MPQPKRFTDEELRDHKNARARQHYLENKGKRAEYHAEWHKAKSLYPDYVRRIAEKSAAHRAKNPEYTKSQNAKRRAKDPELARLQSREWFAANPDKRAEYEQNRRAKKRNNGGVITPGLKAKLFEAQKKSCVCCKKQFNISSLHMDHIIPISKGGPNEDKNIQLLCQPCNQSKHAKHPIDFMQERGYLL